MSIMHLAMAIWHSWPESHNLCLDLGLQMSHQVCLQEQYIELNSAIDANSSLFGLEERTASAGLRLQRAGRPLAMWNHDTLSANADTNLYGSHPFVLEVRPGTVFMSCSLHHHEISAIPCVVFPAACTVVCTHCCFFINHLARRQHLQCMQDHIWHACTFQCDRSR